MNKEILTNILDKYKELQSINGTPKDIFLFSGLKPASYHVPNILGYLNHPPYSDRGESLEFAWFVEIWINDICIWRKSRMNSTGENLQQYEEELCIQILEEMSFYGLYSCYIDTKKRNEERGFHC